MQGRIFSIEEFSTFDGPGIRMTVFFKGCPLKCLWCHNPEGQSFLKEYYRSPNGCTGCNNCLIAGKLREESIFKCKRNLVRAFGEDVSADELCEKIIKNEMLLKMNSGGVTFSGGEPTGQMDFLIECLKKLKGRVHTCVQTCGYSEKFELVLENADMILYDLKLMDEKEHKRYCGTDNETILENYKRLAGSKIPFVTRIPLIPGITDTRNNLEKTAKFLKENNVNYIEALPYNALAGAKYKGLLREYGLEIDISKSVDPGKIFAQYGVKFKTV